MNIHDLFVERLREVIDSRPRGYQAELAESLGFTRGAFSNIVNGRNKGSAEEWRRAVCKLTGIDYEKLVQEADRMADAQVTIKQKHSGHASSGRMEVTHHHGNIDLSVEEQMLLNLIREKDRDKKILRRVIAELLTQELPEK